MEPQGGGGDKVTAGGGGRDYNSGGNFRGGNNSFRGRGYNNYGHGGGYGRGNFPNNNFGGGNFPNNNFGGGNFPNNNYGGGFRGGGVNVKEMTEEELRAKLQQIEAMKESSKQKSVASGSQQSVAKDKQVVENSESAMAVSGELGGKGNCFACGRPGHTETSCPKKLADLGLHLCAYGIPGQMFHSIHVELEEGEDVTQQVSGILTVIAGVATEEMIVRELCELYEDQKVWMVKELTPTSFLVVFPNKECRKGLTRFKKGFYFITGEIKATVVESQLDVNAFEVLTDVWVRAFGIPQWAKKEKVVRQLAFFVGEPKVVDKASLTKPNWVRVKVGCRDPAMVGGANNVYINGQGYRIRWEVEGVYGTNAPPPPNNGPGGSGGGSGRNNGSNGGRGDDSRGNRGNEPSNGDGNGGRDGGMDEDDDLLGDELGDDANGTQDALDYDNSQDHAPGWEKVVRYAEGGVFDNISMSVDEQRMTESKAYTEIISSLCGDSVVSPPVEDEVVKGPRVEVSMAPCQSSKNLKRVKQPVVATRFSKRLNRDGVPVQQKAEARMSSKNDLSAMEASAGRQASSSS